MMSQFSTWGRAAALALFAAFAGPVTGGPAALADGHADATSGLVQVQSGHSADDTLARVEGVIAQRGLKVFQRIDHAAAAAEFDREMPPTWVVIFGNPGVGTGLMLQSPTAAIDLPLKILIYQDAEGVVRVGYNTPEHMAAIYERHGLPTNMDWYVGLMGGLVSAALE